MYSTARNVAAPWSSPPFSLRRSSNHATSQMSWMHRVSSAQRRGFPGAKAQSAGPGGQPRTGATAVAKGGRQGRTAGAGRPFTSLAMTLFTSCRSRAKCSVRRTLMWVRLGIGVQPRVRDVFDWVFRQCPNRTLGPTNPTQVASSSRSRVPINDLLDPRVKHSTWNNQTNTCFVDKRIHLLCFSNFRQVYRVQT